MASSPSVQDSAKTDPDREPLDDIGPPGMVTTHGERPDCAFHGPHNIQGCGVWANLGTPVELDRNGYVIPPAPHVETWAEYVSTVLTRIPKREFADRCGVSMASVDRWLAGQNAPMMAVQDMLREEFR